LDVVASEKKGNWQSMAQSAILMIEKKKEKKRPEGSGEVDYCAEHGMEAVYWIREGRSGCLLIEKR
jgi:hypothetical protein